ncbi:CD74 molecule, major histocompatibility complex, class II invariant chain a [Nematolebias whitei]|uniref:CD74 molecule, major histocompatibility complex, class II invariant chain a n=1 Tax=Nematolebias whitei TaxID=451745 RepID=UPI00189B002F|nr:CD74 molecule, major histocompatibility complex, class II invariant chain a [Nematolebias whitei]
MTDGSDDAPQERRSLAGSEEALVAPGAPRGGSNSRALKIAGLTTLACLLLASQVFTAYMVFDQKQQIHTLQRNSERMEKQLTRASRVVGPARMAIPMSSLPLLTEFTEVDTEKPETPLTNIQDVAVVSVEKQLMDLMKDFSLPRFNETFLTNLQKLKQQVNDSEWKSFESWMRHWLIFQMAQQEPASPSPQPASLIKTKCQMEASPTSHRIGTFKPRCDEQGRYLPTQCFSGTGYCWCVDEFGNPIQGSQKRGSPDCRRGAVFPRTMALPSLMQATSLDDGKK